MKCVVPVACGRMTGETKKWALIRKKKARKWHQVTALGTALCGEPLPAGFERHESDEVLDDVRAYESTVCGRCEGKAKAAQPKHADDGGAPAVRKLTAAQQELVFRIEAQRNRQAEMIAADRKDRASRSTSRYIRTASGGLPGLGKRKS